MADSHPVRGSAVNRISVLRKPVVLRDIRIVIMFVRIQRSPSTLSDCRTVRQRYARWDNRLPDEATVCLGDATVCPGVAAILIVFNLLLASVISPSCSKFVRLFSLFGLLLRLSLCFCVYSRWSLCTLDGVFVPFDRKIAVIWARLLLRGDRFAIKQPSPQPCIGVVNRNKIILDFG